MSWQDGISVPMPKIYVPDEDFVGKKVTLHSCEFHEHLDPAEGFSRKDVSLTGNCNCKLKGKTVIITGLKQTSRARFYRSTCYKIAESSHLIHEFEFSPERQNERPGVTAGYILEGEPNHFLTAGFTYVKKDRVTDGYLHNTGVIKDLLKAKWNKGSTPMKAYPAEYNWKAGSTRVIGEALSWEQLREKVLIK